MGKGGDKDCRVNVYRGISPRNAIRYNIAVNNGHEALYQRPVSIDHSEEEHYSTTKLSV